MPTPSERLARSLETLGDLQRDGRQIFLSQELGRADRERLQRNGFLQPVVKGWWMATSPDTRAGDSTPWWASFWEFCSRYCRERFGEAWHLSPQQSLLLHAEATAIPRQVIVYSPVASNNLLELPFETSLLGVKTSEALPDQSVVERGNGLRLFTVPAALTRVPEDFFRRHPVEAQIVLALVRDPSDLLGPLLEGGHSGYAGRIAGALRRVERGAWADELLGTMKAAGFDVREQDPFPARASIASPGARSPPISQRLRALWRAGREAVLATFPSPSSRPVDAEEILRRIDDAYRADAYHSLSIEGYQVTPELIERVRQGSWSPGDVQEDRQTREALAARGYWQAFQRVRATVAEALAGADTGADAAKLVERDHRTWHRELFAPCVEAGLLPARALAGYRNHAVYLRGSRHVPPRWEAVRDATPCLWELVAAEPAPGVRAVLGHWLFGYVHPYPDGNGRMARFLMNVLLVAGGFPWTVLRVEDREAYLAALEAASVDGDLAPFAELLARSTLRDRG